MKVNNPVLVAMQSFLARHGTQCQGRSGEQVSADIRLPHSNGPGGSIRCNCTCGWHTEVSAPSAAGKGIGVMFLLMDTPVTISRDAGDVQ